MGGFRPRTNRIIVGFFWLSASSVAACLASDAAVAQVTKYIAVQPIDVCATKGPVTTCAPFNTTSFTGNPTTRTAPEPDRFRLQLHQSHHAYGRLHRRHSRAVKSARHRRVMEPDREVCLTDYQYGDRTDLPGVERRNQQFGLWSPGCPRPGFRAAISLISRSSPAFPRPQTRRAR